MASSNQCRMVTKSGHRCTRKAERGSMGFCWQHVPTDDKSAREKWKMGLEGAALTVAGSEVVMKIVELALEYLPELFGSGGDQIRAKHELQGYFPEAYGDMPEEYEVGSRVDWKTLLKLFHEARRTQENPSASGAEQLEKRFGIWFNEMNSYHQNLLLEAITEQARKTT